MCVVRVARRWGHEHCDLGQARVSNVACAGEFHRLTLFKTITKPLQLTLDPYSAKLGPKWLRKGRVGSFMPAYKTPALVWQVSQYRCVLSSGGINRAYRALSRADRACQTCSMRHMALEPSLPDRGPAPGPSARQCGIFTKQCAAHDHSAHRLHWVHFALFFFVLIFQLRGIAPWHALQWASQVGVFGSH